MSYQLTEFVSDVENLFLGGDPSIEQVKPFLHRFLGSPSLYSKINEELKMVMEDPLYVPRYLHGNNLIIYGNSKWSLLYSLYEHIPAHLYTFPMNSLIAPVGESVLDYDLYDLPSTYRNNVFDREVQLAYKNSSSARFGDIVSTNGTTTVIDLRLTRPVGVLKFLIPNPDTLQWTFDRKTRMAVQPISATATGSELSFMAQVLGVLKNGESADKLIRLSKEHPQHHVRWEAIKALGKINPQQGLVAIKAAVNDVHPHIVAAAKRTLARNLLQ